MQSFLAGVDLELHLLTFGEALEPIHLDGGEVDEHIFSTVLFDEAITLGVIEPLHLPSCHRSCLLQDESVLHVVVPGKPFPTCAAYIGFWSAACQESRARRQRHPTQGPAMLKSERKSASLAGVSLQCPKPGWSENTSSSRCRLNSHVTTCDAPTESAGRGSLIASGSPSAMTTAPRSLVQAGRASSRHRAFAPSI